jgi:predicted oxidoreductase
MKMIRLANGNVESSVIALGCLRISPLPGKTVSKLIHTAIDEGINFFDHADIYGGGRSEEAFGKVLKEMPQLREKMILQTKCGIGKGYYDSSWEHIVNSVDGSLRRLGTDYVDILLLHRPDALMQPERVAEAFSDLQKSGKVRYFGVSNHNSGQIELLRRVLEQEIVVNQLQLSVAYTGMIDAGLNVNINHEPAYDRDHGVLEYCRLNNITMQAWSPLHYDQSDEVFLDNEKYPLLNHMLSNMAESKGVSPSAIAVAWIMRLPAGIQPIIGTTQPERLRQICHASSIELSRQEWYALYQAAGNHLP